ncbi:MAG: TAT-variant-translocated molybdopterin oxidoreductase [Cytophagales bacterium]|nr:TAT-variant-translocated molybdopterin oxidoreductase [Cytophagales bacterium]
MMKNGKVYWQGLEELTDSQVFENKIQDEFPEQLPKLGQEDSGESSRRDFLKLMGFGVAAVSLAACEAPVRKAIPYLNKPVDADPGIPNYYASAYTKSGEYCPVVVKTRDGRPIKVEGNKLCSITKGGTSAQVEASVLSLYDNDRLQIPVLNGETAEWDTLDSEVKKQLSSIAVSGGAIRLVSNTIISPATLSVIEKFKAKYPNTEHVMYDAQSFSGLLDSNEMSFGARIIPTYDSPKPQL